MSMSEYESVAQDVLESVVPPSLISRFSMPYSFNKGARDSDLFWQVRKAVVYTQKIGNVAEARNTIELELTATKPERTMREFLPAAVFLIISIVTFFMLLHGRGVL